MGGQNPSGGSVGEVLLASGRTLGGGTYKTGFNLVFLVIEVVVRLIASSIFSDCSPSPENFLYPILSLIFSLFLKRCSICACIIDSNFRAYVMDVHLSSPVRFLE